MFGLLSWPKPTSSVSTGAPLVLAGGPVGLGGYLGSLGTFLRQYYDSLVPYVAWRQHERVSVSAVQTICREATGRPSEVWLINYCGIVLFVLLFVMSFLNHAKDEYLKRRALR